jgi:hypothetical protein
METMSIETIPIGLITSTAYPFVDPSPVHNRLKSSIRYIMEQFQFFEFAIAIQLVFVASEFKALSICEKLFTFRNAVARFATD